MPRRLLKNRTIEVILLQQDKHLGEKYEVVRVKPIFARNVLLPKGIAVLADNTNLNKYKQKMLAAQKALANKASNFEDLLMKIHNDGGLNFHRKANKENVLYAQVSDIDIVNEIKNKYGIEVETHYIKVKKKIKEIGEYSVPFIFQDLKKDIQIIIMKEKEDVKKEKEDSVKQVENETVEENTDKNE